MGDNVVLTMDHAIAFTTLHSFQKDETIKVMEEGSFFWTKGIQMKWWDLNFLMKNTLLFGLWNVAFGRRQHKEFRTIGSYGKNLKFALKKYN